MSFLYDITTQAAGTRSFNSSSFKGDGDQPISTMPIYDYDDESFCSSGTLSTSTSLTSLSSSISDDEILTRPSSSQGWSFDGAWSIGEPVYTPKFQSQSSLSIHIDDHDKDLTERGLIESQVSGLLQASTETYGYLVSCCSIRGLPTTSNSGERGSCPLDTRNANTYNDAQDF